MDELRIIAEALCQSWVEDDSAVGTLVCRLCFRKVPNYGATEWDSEAIQHETDCPVLLAKAILTRQHVTLPTPRKAGRSFNFDD
jgi:hypothetical protein